MKIFVDINIVSWYQDSSNNVATFFVITTEGSQQVWVTFGDSWYCLIIHIRIVSYFVVIWIWISLIFLMLALHPLRPWRWSRKRLKVVRKRIQHFKRSFRHCNDFVKFDNFRLSECPPGKRDALTLLFLMNPRSDRLPCSRYLLLVFPTRWELPVGLWIWDLISII